MSNEDDSGVGVDGQEPQLLEVDGRGRVALGTMRGGRNRFLAHSFDDGSILLEPAVVLSEAEVRLLSAPALHSRLDVASKDGVSNRGRRG